MPDSDIRSFVLSGCTPRHLTKPTKSEIAPITSTILKVERKGHLKSGVSVPQHCLFSRLAQCDQFNHIMPLMNNIVNVIVTFKGDLVQQMLPIALDKNHFAIVITLVPQE